MRKLCVLIAAALGCAAAATAQPPSQIWKFYPEAVEAKVSGRSGGVLRLACPERGALMAQISSKDRVNKGDQPFRVVFVGFDGREIADQRIWAYEGAKARLTKDWAVEEFIKGALAAKEIAVTARPVKGKDKHFHFANTGLAEAVGQLRTACAARG